MHPVKINTSAGTHTSTGAQPISAKHTKNIITSVQTTQWKVRNTKKKLNEIKK